MACSSLVRSKRGRPLEKGRSKEIFKPSGIGSLEGLRQPPCPPPSITMAPDQGKGLISLSRVNGVALSCWAGAALIGRVRGVIASDLRAIRPRPEITKGA
jgi:hypothetical protein